MGWYVLTKLTRPITGLLERDLRRMEEKGKVWEVDKRWIGLCMYKGWRWGKLMWSRGEVGRRGEGGSTHSLKLNFYLFASNLANKLQETMGSQRKWK